MVTLSWQTFTAPDGRTIYAGSVDSPITAGAVNVTLEPGQYTAVYNIVPSGCVPAYEEWIVPVPGLAGQPGRGALDSSPGSLRPVFARLAGAGRGQPWGRLCAGWGRCGGRERAAEEWPACSDGRAR